MSALNMAMNGNAYKMIEIKKVSGPVVPLRKHFISNHKLSLSLSLSFYFLIVVQSMHYNFT